MAQKRFYDLEDPRDLQTVQKLIFDNGENKNPTLKEDFDDDPDTDADGGLAEGSMGGSDSEESGSMKNEIQTMNYFILEKMEQQNC